MNIELTFITLIFSGIFYILYLASGIFSILLCEKYSILRKYFTKAYIGGYLFITFFFIFYLIPTTSFNTNKLSMPIVAMLHILFFSIAGNLFYKRFKINNFFNTEFYQCAIGVAIFTVLNSIRVYFQYFF
jgi:hypothetical protein